MGEFDASNEEFVQGQDFDPQEGGSFSAEQNEGEGQDIKIDPAYADYFNDTYPQYPQQPNYGYPQQPVYQQPVQQPVQQQQYQYPQQVQSFAPQQQVQQVQQESQGIDVFNLDADKLLEQFDNDPKAVLKAVAQAAALQAKNDILQQIPNIINPQVENVKAELELKQTQERVANTVEGNLAKSGIVVPPAMKAEIYGEVANKIDNAWSKYNAAIQTAILNGQPVSPTLLSNGRPLSEEEFAVNFATQLAKFRYKEKQAFRVQQQGGNPSYNKQSVNQVYSNTFNATNGGVKKDLRAMSEEELENYGKANGLSWK